MYLMPQAMLVQHFGPASAWSGPAITWGGMLGNWLAVMAGNLIGGSVLVGMSYHLIYRRTAPPSAKP
jgi:formate transporter